MLVKNWDFHVINEPSAKIDRVKTSAKFQVRSISRRKKEMERMEYIDSAVGLDRQLDEQQQAAAIIDGGPDFDPSANNGAYYV